MLEKEHSVGFILLLVFQAQIARQFILTAPVIHLIPMGAYSSSFVVEPKADGALSSITNPSQANWITAHAVSVELSIAEVERLWMRFQQMGANSNGVLTSDTLAFPKLASDVFVKNILKYFKSTEGNVSFESYLRALKWCESQDINVKSRAIFQMLNNGNPINKDLFQKILKRVYPESSEEEVTRVMNIFFRAVDNNNRGQIDETSFSYAVVGLPRAATQAILNFQILPDEMRENIHQNLPEFSSQTGYHTPSIYESQIPSDNLLKEVAEKIHRKDWDLVANRLGFFADDIQTMRLNNPNSTYKQAFQMLRNWKSREGENAKASTLEKNLRNAGMIEASLILAP